MKYSIHKNNTAVWFYISKVFMKVVSSIGNLKNRAKNCQIVKRRDRIYLISKANPRFKVRQGRGTKKRR